jgi:acetate kinase
MREVLAAASRAEPRGVLARDVYLHRLRGAIAGMVASLGGLDALVFTGGVGEHAPSIRAGAVSGMGFLGLEIDEALNSAPAGDARIDARSGPAILVIESREDLEIARQVRTALA